MGGHEIDLEPNENWILAIEVLDVNTVIGALRCSISEHKAKSRQ